jgi:predicted transcriptional regulator YheO
VTEKDTVGNNRHSMRSGENTSKELTELEEVSARIATLVDMLHEKGVINKKVFERTLAMRLHEISKATVFAEMSD